MEDTVFIIKNKCLFAPNRFFCTKKNFISHFSPTHVFVVHRVPERVVPVEVVCVAMLPVLLLPVGAVPVVGEGGGGEGGGAVEGEPTWREEGRRI